MTDISNTDDILDVRDIIARYEELEEDWGDSGLELLEDPPEEEEAREFEILKELLEDLNGNGGDHQWKGDWYPVTLIHENYFVDSMEELCKDCGYISSEVPWFIEIDWEKTAEHLRMDYMEVEFDGETYWYS